MDPSRALVLLVATVAMAAAGVGGDIAADRAECMDTLMDHLATCLPYVQEQATAAAPTPECCAGLKTVVQTSPKCLCVLVKDKDDPSLGLKIDATRALGLPQACKAPADISKCPELLNLPPNSKDAQAFEQYAKQMGGAPTSAPGGAGSNATASAGAEKSGAMATRWLGVDGKAVLSIFSAAAPLAMPFLLLLG